MSLSSFFIFLLVQQKRGEGGEGTEDTVQVAAVWGLLVKNG